jgi:transcriptional regulator with XRE-family HTH domain
MADFGYVLRKHREARGLSQSKLAEAADFDHSYVSRLESGARMPTREAIDRLAEALGVTEIGHDQLLTSAGFLPSDSAILLMHPQLAQLDRALAACPDQQVKDDALAAVRTIIKALPFGEGGST